MNEMNMVLSPIKKNPTPDPPSFPPPIFGVLLFFLFILVMMVGVDRVVLILDLRMHFNW